MGCPVDNLTHESAVQVGAEDVKLILKGMGLNVTS